MATGLNATLITFVPNEVAKSADVNSNLAALNGAANPNFTTCQVQSRPTIVLGSGSYSGFHIFVGPTQPTGMVKGDVWIKTPF